MPVFISSYSVSFYTYINWYKNFDEVLNHVQISEWQQRKPITANDESIQHISFDCY